MCFSSSWSPNSAERQRERERERERVAEEKVEMEHLFDFTYKPSKIVIKHIQTPLESSQLFRI